MKKRIKILSIMIFTTVLFYAQWSPVQAATNVDELVKDAQDKGTVLKWAISTEGSADGKTRPYAQFNEAKAARDKAVTAINTLPAAQKATYLAKIESGVNIHITRTTAYIDAITAGEKITAKQARVTESNE